MLIQQAFQFTLRPNGEQQRAFRRTAGCRRYVMNKALKIQQDNHAAGGKYMSYATLCKQLTAWRAAPEQVWLKDAPSQSLQQGLKDLDRAFQNFFKGLAAFPSFRKKDRGDSFRFPDPKQCKVDEANSRIFLPKTGWIRYRNSRPITGTIRNLTISRRGDKWLVSIQTEREVEQPVPTATTAVGIDMGVVHLMTFSDGTHIKPLNGFTRRVEQMRKAQRAMSRKVKFSSNWKKAKARVTRLHTRIANARKDYAHKATTTISKNHALVGIEDLRIANMSKSAKGTVEQPGKNVKAKSGLNRSILDQGWGEIARQLDYKLRWRGAWLIAVPPAYTSQECPACGHTERANRPSQDVFCCGACGHAGHADVIAAGNVKRRALHIVSQEGQDTVHACAGYASTARIACQVNGAVGPSAAGTH